MDCRQDMFDTEWENPVQQKSRDIMSMLSTYYQSKLYAHTITKLATFAYVYQTPVTPSPTSLSYPR